MLLIELDGDIITTKEYPFAPNTKALGNLAKELSDYWQTTKEQMIIIHGGGNFTHVAEGQFSKNLAQSDNKKPAALTWAMRKLNDHVLESLADFNLPVYPLQTSALINIPCKFAVINQAVVKKTVALGYIPVLYSDIIPTETGGQVVSGEEIMELLYEHFTLTRIIVCSAMDGVPVDAKNTALGLVSRIDHNKINDVLDNLGNASLLNIMGTLEDKLKILYNVSVRAGVNTQIINGTKPGLLTQ
jgi:isopentenyl phosphate kinase